MVPVVVTPPVVMAPMIMVAPVAIVTDAPRPVIGPDHPAAAVRIIIGIIIIRVVGRAVEETPVKVMVVREPNAAEPGATKTMASAVEDRTAAKPAAMEYGAAGSQAATMKHRTAAAAMERCGPTMKSAATVERRRRGSLRRRHESRRHLRHRGTPPPPPPPPPCPPPPRTSVVSPPETAFAVGAAPGLISDSACARCGTVESVSIAAAARPKEYRKRRATPRRGFEILIMYKASLNSGNESPGHQSA